jgi:hypothetical protein
VYVREPAAFAALGAGDINTYKLFLERFFTLLCPHGHMGIVVPSGLYTDQGCLPLRQLFFNQSQIDFLYCFENRWPTIFPAVDGRFKFVVFGTEKGGETKDFKCAFMEHDPERLPEIEERALKMQLDYVKKFSPESLSVMEFKNQKDIKITGEIYGLNILLGQKKDGWDVKFLTEFHITNDSHLLTSNPTDYPLYEGKMIWQFNSFYDLPSFWVANENLPSEPSLYDKINPRLAHRRISASTNERTLVCAFIPPKALSEINCTLIIPIEIYLESNNRYKLYLMGILNSFILDFVIRHKITTTLNMFYMKSLPIVNCINNVDYLEIKKIMFLSICARVARLTCTNIELETAWEDAYINEFSDPSFWYPQSNHFIDQYGPKHEQAIRQRIYEEAQSFTENWGPHCGVYDRTTDRRDTGDRAQLRAEVDAYVAHLYGLNREDFAYILNTFPVLRQKEEKAFGEFMSKRKCLEEYDRIATIL